MRSHFKILLRVFTVVSLLASTLVANPTLAKQNTSKTIVVFGDSLSAAYGLRQEEGWVSLLQQHLIQQKIDYHLINASISGETTSGGLNRFPDMLKNHKPNIVMIELGANDGLRGLSAEETYKNLNAMIQLAKKTNAKVLLLGMKIPPNYGLKYSRTFSENYQNLANKNKIALVPFFLDGVAGKPELVQADGLHPNAEAQTKLLENVLPRLMPLLKN
jgi:acyl-CoA thioesterase-1